MAAHLCNPDSASNLVIGIKERSYWGLTTSLCVVTVRGALEFQFGLVRWRARGAVCEARGPLQGDTQQRQAGLAPLLLLQSSLSETQLPSGSS